VEGSFRPSLAPADQAALQPASRRAAAACIISFFAEFHDTMEQAILREKRAKKMAEGVEDQTDRRGQSGMA
jgi:hypothetical protein